MSDCKTYPADKVDVYGNVWPTVGENIRNGLFGMKVKRGFIEIEKGNITSKEFKITHISEKQFFIDKKIIILFPILLKSGYSVFSYTLATLDRSVVMSSGILKDISFTLEVIYQE